MISGDIVTLSTAGMTAVTGKTETAMIGSVMTENHAVMIAVGMRGIEDLK